MIRRDFWLLAALLPSALSFQPARSNVPPMSRIHAAIAFMGGETALRAIRTRRTTSTEITFGIGQGELPELSDPSSSSTSVVTFDYARNIQRRVQVPAGTNASQVATFVTQDDRLMMVIQDTLKRRVGGSGVMSVARSMRRSARLSVESLLLACATGATSSLREAGRGRIRGQSATEIEARLASDTVWMWFADSDGRLLAIETRQPDPLFGIRIDRDEFASWTRHGSVMMPSVIISTANGRPTRTVLFTKTEINVPAVDSLPEVPADFVPAAIPSAVTTVATLAPGVIRIEGGDGIGGYGGGIPYYSFAVQQGDSVILIEAPIDEQRSRDVLNAVTRAFPSQRVTGLVVTHAHFDHIGGTRWATSRGLRLVAATELEPFLKRSGISGRKNIVKVGDSLTVGTGDTRFVLYQVPTVHARGMLVAYFPAHRLLVESDLQGAALPTQQHELFDWITRSGLAVERIAGTHGREVTWTVFRAQLQ